MRTKSALMMPQFLCHCRTSWGNTVAVIHYFLFSCNVEHLPLSLSGLCLSQRLMRQGKARAQNEVDRPGNAEEQHEVSAEPMNNMRWRQSR